jgi:hypothetical protein
MSLRPFVHRAIGHVSLTGGRGLRWCIVLTVLGCGGPTKATFKVHGTVLDAGRRPAVGAIIVLQPVSPDPNDAARPTATVSENGGYALTTYTTGDGAPEGLYAVTVIWPAPRKTPFDPPGVDRLDWALARVGPASPRIRVTREPNQSAPEIVLPPEKKSR